MHDVDFNIQFGDGYLDDTRQPTIRGAINQLRKSISLLSTLTTGASVNALPDVGLRDGLHLSGQSLSFGLGQLLESASADLTVHNDGRIYFIGRTGIDNSSKLPKQGDYKWATEPPWFTRATTIMGRPRTIYAYSPERHCLRIEYATGDDTVVSRGPQSLRVELEQVYSSGGEYFTLDELLSEYDFPGELTDADVAHAIMSETLEGTTLYDSYGTANFEAVQKALVDGWRRLFRIKFSGTNGALGGWKDWAAGKINADGSVQPVAVECPWVEFLNVALPTNGIERLVDSPMTVNHDSPSPFTVVFEGDVSNGIIRLQQRALRDNNLAIPGALTEPLRLAVKNSVEDGQGAAYTLDNMKLIEREDRGKARFDPTFSAAIYLCATRQMPNDETRWHSEAVKGYSDGDISFVELPPGEAVCVRDYVGGDKLVLGDGLGAILNQDELTIDAGLRADSWKAEQTAALEGSGVAESLMLFNDYEVDGPISEITLDVKVTETSCTVQTIITAGNIGDTDVASRIAANRNANRKWQGAGK